MHFKCGKTSQFSQRPFSFLAPKEAINKSFYTELKLILNGWFHPWAN